MDASRAFQAIRDTVLEDAHIQSLPRFLNTIVDLFGKSHLYYRTFKQTRIFVRASQNRSRGHPAVYGAALQLIGDYTSIGSYALNLALVTKCAEDLLREYRQLNQTYQKLQQVVRWQYPLYRPVEWRSGAQNHRALVSPSLHLSLQVEVMGFVKQLLKISRCVLAVLGQAFKLSMCLRDAHLLFNGDPQMRYEACTELVAQWDDYLRQLKEDYQRILEQIQNNFPLADRILTRLNATKTSHFVIETLKQQLNFFVEKVEDLAQDLFDVHEDVLDTVYVKGKITPICINLAEGKFTTSALPPARFPPWAGQRIEIIESPSQKKTPPIDAVEQFLLKNAAVPFDSLVNSAKSLLMMADCVYQVYKEQNQTPPKNTPFV